MVEIFRGYIHTIKKKPIQKFKGVDTLPTLDEVKDLDEYAGILNDEFSVMDIDDSVESEKAFEVVKALGLNCRVVKTTRGMHFIFKKNKYADKGNTHQTNALGLTFDVRTGVNQYIVVKYGGKVREVLQDFDETKEITSYPKLFKSIKSEQKFTGMKDGDGRNGALFNYLITLVRNGFDKDECIQIVNLINDYIFDDHLSEYEINQICRDDAFKGIEIETVQDEFGENDLKLKNFSESEVAEIFAKHYKKELRYNPGTDWLVWNGKVWEMSQLKAQKKYLKFQKELLKCAREELRQAYASDGGNEDKIKAANKFYNYVVKLGDSNKVSGVLKLARSFLEIDISELDAYPFEINTPEGIVDLKTEEIKPHDPDSFCTKITMCSPSEEGFEMFQELLDLVTLNDPEYQNYLKVLCGAIAIGKVYHEALIMAFGNGANGKSTLFNTIHKVLGKYSGKIPAESLTTQNKSIKNDLAEIFGKRFVLAGETEEGQRLSNMTLKKIASSDELIAERKYHDPFTFDPSQTVLLYTNFLPRLGSLDHGTKRRIILCPFNATITKPVKDYAEKLLTHSGGAIMKWIVEGAKEFYERGYTLPECKVVAEAQKEYFEENNWLDAFLEDCCVVDKKEKVAGGVLYKAYRTWCGEVGEFTRRNSDFSRALSTYGFEKKRTNKGIMWSGLSIDAESIVGKRISEEFL